jgi:CBS domain-containing protein
MLTVSQLLAGKNHRLETVAPNEHVFEALKLMFEKDIGSLLVVEFGKLAGIFTERDYARKLVLQGKSSQNTLVRDVMSTKLITVKPEDSLDFWMLSIGDLLKAALSEQANTIKQLESYING